MTEPIIDIVHNSLKSCGISWEDSLVSGSDIISFNLPNNIHNPKCILMPVDNALLLVVGEFTESFTDLNTFVDKSVNCNIWNSTLPPDIESAGLALVFHGRLAIKYCLNPRDEKLMGNFSDLLKRISAYVNNVYDFVMTD